MRLVTVVLLVLIVLFNSPVNAQGGWSVVAFVGDVADVPDGWQLCDGSNGSPDLRDRFIVGAGPTHANLTTGGAVSSTVTHGHTIPDHDHAISSVDLAHSHTVNSHAHAVNIANHTHELAHISYVSGSIDQLVGNELVAGQALGTQLSDGDGTMIIRGYSTWPSPDAENSTAAESPGTDSALSAHDHGGTTGAAALSTGDVQITTPTEPPYMAALWICAPGGISSSAPLTASMSITDPTVTDYYTTTTGIAYRMDRTITHGEQTANYLLIAILCLGVLQFIFQIVTARRHGR